MKSLRARPGTGILETIVGLSLFCLVVMGAHSLLSTMFTSSDRTGAQANANADATMALQHIVDDLREAKEFQIEEPGPDEGSRLVIVYPVKNADGSYDRGDSDPDPNNQVTYYVQNRTLWRLSPSESPDPTPIRWGVNDEFTPGEDPGTPATWTNESGIEELRFVRASGRAVNITVKAYRRRQIPTANPETGELVREPQQMEITQQMVSLRNW
jgi:type II secretory pathway component PulJ